jgi:hypothetical protein
MSVQRHCAIYLANNQKWYVELGDREYASRSESTAYGPFCGLHRVGSSLKRRVNLERR